MDERFSSLRWLAADDPNLRQLTSEPRGYVFDRPTLESPGPEDALDMADVFDWACVPLMSRGRVIGKLTADNKACRGCISQGHADALFVLQLQLAAAIQDAPTLLDPNKRPHDRTIVAARSRYD
jgi:hypothetical protein